MMRPRTALALPLLVALLGALPGCGGDKRPASQGQAAVTSGDYISQYRAGNYAAARASAEMAAASSTGKERETALLVQGMSAHAMGRMDEAERILKPLTTNADREIAGRAQATLGLIAKSRGQHTKAGELLADASGDLSGDFAAQAALRAGDSLAAAGQNTAAKTQYQSGLAEAQSTVLKKAIQSRLETGAFTVQLGVFVDRRNADRAAAAVAGRTSTAGLGRATVWKRAGSNGKTEYVVSAGRYDVRFQASAAQQRLGQGIVATLADAN
ncbi:MAG: tetratricopeptide repeat protein [Phycisphaeraceae bacterium]|nr:tetratricopeptide repeat protein [Phycisphaeraceae bacterium]